MFLIKKFMRAVSGFCSIMKTESSIRIEFLFFSIAVFFAWRVGVNRFELIVLIILSFAVVIVEGINTVTERMMDLVEPRYRAPVRDIKDAMAGLVLLTVVGACLIFVFIVWPYLYGFLV